MRLSKRSSTITKRIQRAQLLLPSRRHDDLRENQWRFPPSAIHALLYIQTAKQTTTSHAWASSTPPPRLSNSAEARTSTTTMLPLISHRARLRPGHRHEDRHRPTQTLTQKTPSPRPRPSPLPHLSTRPPPRLATSD